MFKPTLPLMRDLRRLKLTTKMVGSGFYKGNRVGSTGRFVRKQLHWVNPFTKRWEASYGRHSRTFEVDYDKVRTYKVPDLSSFKLTPFVSKRIERPAPDPDFEGIRGGPTNGLRYLEIWKRDNGVD